MASRETITERQFLHMKQALATYATTEGVTFAHMAHRANLGHGTIATLAREHYDTRPTVLLARRIMSGLGMTEAELLGPDEPVDEESPEPTLWDQPGEPPCVLGDTNGDMLETLSALRSLVETVQALHRTQGECYGTLRDIHAVLLAMWDRQLRT